MLYFFSRRNTSFSFWSFAAIVPVSRSSRRDWSLALVPHTGYQQCFPSSLVRLVGYRFGSGHGDATLQFSNGYAQYPLYLGLALDVIISLPYAIRIEESPNNKLLRILPLLFGSLSTIYMVIGWVCLVRYPPLTIPSMYQPIANDLNQGNDYDLVSSTDTSAGRCSTLFSAQLLSSQAVREDQNERIQPISNTAHPKGLASVGSVTQFSPALIFWTKGLNPLQALIVALPFILMWSGVNMAYQISSYCGIGGSGEMGRR
ncbi:hypothetical protein F4820DRAFT_79416 [Hypoxylon rubiginosum]|uniref:Uncharacterized protein n=1 Tax=Hypoxylon rubiginosum TaxID=110542 RepID=A0ACB9YP53_9PEZI|nr:hypothetical protein F4820DRAFT_79416 [Hypoxylon rubiginosum]